MDDDRIRIHKRWKKDPRCFWCGEVTVWVEGINKCKQPNIATIDHIKSKWHKGRTNDNPGMIVLACYKCNNDRNKYEQAWFAAADMEAFYARGNGRPNKTILRIQTKVCAALHRLLKAGGSVVGPDNRVQSLMHHVDMLTNEYSSKKLKK